MRKGARRLASRLLHPTVRRAMPVLCVFLAGSATAQSVTDARYADPTTRYQHGILGDETEYGSLRLTLSDGRRINIKLPENAVFEDTEPRLFDLDQDGDNEVITVESSLSHGARLSVFNATGRIASTPFIGRPNRWLAPLGAADLDGDGIIELAYVDRPHLAKTLRIWRFEEDALTPVADLPGVTNHRIGETDIAGGIRTCAGVPEMILASADWSRLLSVTFRNGKFETTDLGRDSSRKAFARALTCR